MKYTTGIFLFLFIFFSSFAQTNSDCALLSEERLNQFYQTYIGSNKIDSLYNIYRPDTLSIFLKSENEDSLRLLKEWAIVNGYEAKLDKFLFDSNQIYWLMATINIEGITYREFLSEMKKLKMEKDKLGIGDCGAMGVNIP